MNNRTTPSWINDLMVNEIVVGGSNLAGRHGAGFALAAKKKWGAVNGKAEGLQGSCYMIPTKDGRPGIDPYVQISLSISEIKPYVDRFLAFAKSHPELIFRVTEIGCGRANYSPADMAPLFKEAIPLNNIHLPSSFWRILGY